MFSAMWMTPKCRNVDVSSRKYSPCATPEPTPWQSPSTKFVQCTVGVRASFSNTDDEPPPNASPVPVAVVMRKTRTFSPMSVYVTVGASTPFPPYAAFACRTDFEPSATQDGHWKPTDADRMQSGQIGRSQRVQRT